MQGLRPGGRGFLELVERKGRHLTSKCAANSCGQMGGKLGQTHSIATVKQRLKAVRHLFDWMLVSQVMLSNPAVSVRG